MSVWYRCCCCKIKPDTFSTFRLSELVDPPQIVHDLSWVSTFWPHDQPPEDVMFHRPEVQRYCLMGVKDSFTDFHIDFGGTSVWYHVLRVSRRHLVTDGGTCKILGANPVDLSYFCLKFVFPYLFDRIIKCEF